ncbi:hypothetical protein GJ496_011616 [Pomphorhynchus laevis]|nr:hypothetical protein GJ496_011616 [Pomphorhynchus laevis]
MSTIQIAVVTGANKGIGYGIVQALATQFKGIIYLTARNEDIGKAAIIKLKSDNSAFVCKDIIFHQLDISDMDSIRRLQQHLRKTYGGIDILINNAGIAFKVNDCTNFDIQARETIRVNYYGTLNMMLEMLGLIRPNGRYINVSSTVGSLSLIMNSEMHNYLINPQLTISDLNSVMEKFITAAKENTIERDGIFSKSAYGMSKLGLTLLSFCIQREVDRERPDDKILVIPCCPGYVDTDMSSHQGHKTILEG